jgi:succinyl-diaminopimelate desuccinylase
MSDSGTSALRDELITLTTDLMRFRSTDDQPDQVAAALDYVADYLAPLEGLHIYRSEHNGKPALVATLRHTCEPALMLNGHLDVVAAPPDLFEPQVRDGRIYGRGSQDMKGSVAVLLRLLKDLAASEPRPDVGFQFVGDEEIGGRDGTGRLAEEGWRCGFFIAAEPTDMQICTQQKGGMWIKLRLAGAAAHASHPWDGDNPLLPLAAGLQALAERFPAPQQAEWRTTATPTVIRSEGGSSNQVPASVALWVDVRHTTDEQPEAVRDAVHACFPTAQIEQIRGVSALNTSPDEPAVQQLARIVEQQRGRPTPIYREHFASDARYYSEIAIPAVCFGPIGGGLHSADEWVEIDGLVEYYHLLRAYIAEAV